MSHMLLIWSCEAAMPKQKLSSRLACRGVQSPNFACTMRKNGPYGYPLVCSFKHSACLTLWIWACSEWHTLWTGCGASSTTSSIEWCAHGTCTRCDLSPSGQTHILRPARSTCLYLLTAGFLLKRDCQVSVSVSRPALHILQARRQERKALEGNEHITGEDANGQPVRAALNTLKAAKLRGPRRRQGGDHPADAAAGGLSRPKRKGLFADDAGTANRPSGGAFTSLHSVQLDCFLASACLLLKS